MSGIIGVFSVDGKNVTDDLFYGLSALQHRGEEGCGVSVNDGKYFHTLTRDGLVYYFLKDKLEDVRKTRPYVGIGHTLYERTGGLQPVEQWGDQNVNISLAMDGVLLGFGEKKHDSVMRTLFLDYLKETGNFYSAVERVMKKLDGRGPYNVVIAARKGGKLYLIAFRDPKGIKPLCLGKKDGMYVIASETKALDIIEADFVKDVEPGEIIIITKDGMESRILKKDRHAHCAFEWVYFADPTSTIEGRNVYLVRKTLGNKLAERYPLDIDVVMASPDSGRGVAIGYQQGLCKIKNTFVPFEEASIKNPGAKRTFQVENPKERMMAARVKFFINKDIVKGKKVACGDDSIVRGTVFRDGMVYKLRSAGASEIIPVISCPPLAHPCIKDPKGKTFAAQGMTGSVEEIGKKVAKKLNVERVCYPTIKELDESIGHSDTCKACFDGVYPIKKKFIFFDVHEDRKNIAFYIHKNRMKKEKSKR
ncbi:MAG: hypothetical protein JSV39_02900 [Candidatus Aenigmatarchaeota archaeon]|nr:MAG: hypothetical protein JSV39_02900 [Candidatus Aenigmarchaeota archaeon]